MYKFLRPLIFRGDPEVMHHATISMLALGGRSSLGRAMIRGMFPVYVQGPEVNVFGLTFANPLGMAAGYDKEGTAWRGLACLGFGHVEIGTVTPRPQPGNPKPRVFRLAEDEAIINRMGFPGKGVDALLGQLQVPKQDGLILGINIGKNKATPNDEAASDYVELVQKLAEKADYLAINVSSPNTPGLRELQKRNDLEKLLHLINLERNIQVKQLRKNLPLLVKLAPDLSDLELALSLEAISSTGMDGVILGNTTISRNGMRCSQAAEIGGLSGRPLNAINTMIIKKVHALSSGKLPIIASGGVMTIDDVSRKMDAGAVLVQLYSGLIFKGPQLPSKLLNSGLPTIYPSDSTVDSR